MVNSGMPHWEALKCGFSNCFKLMSMLVNFFLNVKYDVNFVGYVNSYYANDRDKEICISSYVYTLFGSCRS